MDALPGARSLIMGEAGSITMTKVDSGFRIGRWLAKKASVGGDRRTLKKPDYFLR
jgi:hypothetical protein